MARYILGFRDTLITLLNVKPFCYSLHVSAHLMLVAKAKTPKTTKANNNKYMTFFIVLKSM